MLENAMPPRKSWNFVVKILGHGKSWKMILDLGSPQICLGGGDKIMRMEMRKYLLPHTSSFHDSFLQFSRCYI